MPKVYTVTEIQRLVSRELEDLFGTIWVEGEISGLKRPASGHFYFALKDARAVLDAVIWRSTANRLRFRPEEGMAVRARGHLTVYEARGKYHMVVDALEPIGTGPLQVAFEQMRKRLEAEGLFDPARRKPLPGCPRRVALVTSPTGAAVRDLVQVALRRWPALELVVVPARVQGAGAAEEVADAVREADRRSFDVIVVARGGGSLEDLWAFNEEPVARAIHAARTPVVSAVGHEVDVTIADLVADMRAPTPSAAAELITLDCEAERANLDARARRLLRAVQGLMRRHHARLDAVLRRAAFQRPLARLRDEEQRLDQLTDRLARAARETLHDARRRCAHAAAHLEALSPLRVLARGYSVTQRDGKVVTRAADVAPGDLIRTLLHEGELRSRVE